MMRFGVLKYRLLLLFTVLILSCGDCPRDEGFNRFILNDKNADWLISQPDSKKYLRSYSSDGLTDSYWFTSERDLESGRCCDDCGRYMTESRHYSYRSTVYGNNFSFDVSFSLDYIESNEIIFTFWYSNFALPEINNFKIIHNLNSDNDSDFKCTVFRPEEELYFDSCLHFIGNYSINQSTYQNVYWYNNEDLKNSGLNYDIVELYFDKKFGLLQFKFKMGRVWTIDYN